MIPYDVIVVGAGFAGLSSALTLARQGLRVCVLERNKEIGKPVRTTGIFIQKLIDEFFIPKQFLENEIKGIFVHSPSGKCYPIKLEGPRFYMGNISRYQKWLANECIKWRVKFHLNTSCNDINIKKSKVKIDGFESKAVILACGSNIDLVRKLTGNSVKKFLIGIEFVGKGINARNPRYFECFFDYDLAPGYGAWIAPITRDVNHVGLCRYSPCNVDIKKKLFEYFKRRIKSKFTIKEVRSGLIPISGPINKTYGDRFLIVGDAAGQTGALSCGGIYFALGIGKIAGKVLSAHIDNPSEDNLEEYEDAWKERYGRSLNYELMARSLWDRIDSNEEMEEALKVLEDPLVLEQMRSILKRYEVSSFHLLQNIFLIVLRNPSMAINLLENLIVER
ncbi:MAG: hypothetical protein DRH24_17745 [Deltaproteobacteria bacterium]|nr:MAG: hypothetical protein DRH24_17745 [Deltaproteobacteria bacterium]